MLTRRRCQRCRARPTTAATLLLLLLLVGCDSSSSNGVASKSAGEILAASRAAAIAASSVHVISRSAQGPAVVRLNLQLTSGGGRAQVSILGVDYEAIRIGDVLYVKGSPVFYKRLAAVTGVHVPVGRWLKAPAGTRALAEFRALTSPSELELLLSTVGSSKGATTTIKGQPVIELREAGKLYAGAMYVATTGKPYPYEILKHGAETSQTTFSDWDEPVSLSAPANAVAIGRSGVG
jgi:hypothetical protein